MNIGKLRRVHRTHLASTHLANTGHRHAAVPPDSELPAVEPEVSAAAVVPHPAADAGGVDNLPEELLSETERLADQLDHARLDVELPGEDQARLDASGD